MKTYWLEKRHTKSFVTRGITISEPQWMSRAAEKRITSPAVGSIGFPGAKTESKQQYTSYNDPSSSSSPTKCPGSRIASPTPQVPRGFVHEEPRIYSPITFQDVARRSVANSPTRSADSGGETRHIFLGFPEYSLIIRTLLRRGRFGFIKNGDFNVRIFKTVYKK